MGNSTPRQYDLQTLVTLGDTEQLVNVLQNNLPPEEVKTKGRALLRSALESGNIQMLKVLMEIRGMDQIRLEMGYTSLHFAVNSRNLNLTRQILQDSRMNIQKNMQDELGRTPLHLAVISESSEAVTLLLKYNASKLIQDYNGLVPVDLTSQIISPIVAQEIYEQLTVQDLIVRYRSKSLLQGQNELAFLQKPDKNTSCCDSKSTLNEGGSNGVRYIKETRNSSKRLMLEKALKKYRLTVIPGIEIQFEDTINRGTSCVVIKGKWRGTDIAVKQFKLEYRNNNKEMKKFVKELKVLADVRHPNLVLLMGVCIDLPHLCIVTEYVPNSTLFSLLHRNTTVRLAFADRLNIAIQLTKALTYLHGRTPPIVHRDLKPENCLMGHGLNLIIADFGLARPLSVFQQESETMTTTCIGTTRFMAPELFDKDKVQNIGVEVDIWALGCMLIEIFSNKRPWHYISSQKVNLIYHEIFQRKPIPIPEVIPLEIRDIIQSCCQYNPKLRIQASNVLLRLENMVMGNE